MPASWSRRPSGCGGTESRLLRIDRSRSPAVRRPAQHRDPDERGRPGSGRPRSGRLRHRSRLPLGRVDGHGESAAHRRRKVQPGGCDLGDGKVVVGFQELTSGFWQGARWVDGSSRCSRARWAASARRSTRPRRLARRRPGVPSRRLTGSERVGVDPAGRRAVFCPSRGPRSFRSRVTSSAAPARRATTAVSSAAPMHSASKATPSSGWTSSPSTSRTTCIPTVCRTHSRAG